MGRVVLGVSGSVAAYRACDLARELRRAGFTVRTCLTDAAEKFVSRALFEALTGEPCLVDVFDEPQRGRMAHIEWAREADVLVIAPATVNTLAKIAHGVGDDMLTTIALAYEGPVVVAPAANPTMFASEPMREALRVLERRGVLVVEPKEGEVACGESGQGKFAPIDEIVSAVLVAAEESAALAGRTVLLTSGPTREPIDAVRFLSNRSSGKMGAALARAARRMGARVVVVTGPASAPLPAGVEVHRVETALQMLEAAERLVEEADWVVGAAAVADYRVETPSSGKLRRGEGPLELRLVPNPDVIAALARRARPGTRVVGFAAEPGTDLAAARAKLGRKGLWAIAVNDVTSPGLGFESEDNALTLVFADGATASCPPQSKLRCAQWLFRTLVARSNPS